MFRINSLLFAALVSACMCGTVSAQTIKSKNPHSQAHKNLLASRAKSDDQIKLVEKNTFIDLIDELEPEPDIYTEG